MQLLWNVFRVLGFTALGLVLLAVGYVVLFQYGLIYHPRPYDPGRIERFGRRVEAVEYRTDQGRQVAFYVPPRGPGPAESLWVLFAGNASLALDWEILVGADPGLTRAFLLVDYPGYGQSEGRASPGSVGRSADAALATLFAARMTAAPGGGRGDGAPWAPPLFLGAAGHSLGSAAALGFAVRHPEVGRVLLVSPFTSLRAMARRLVGAPLSLLLRGNYDNLAQLDELAVRRAPARPPPPPTLIFHGDADSFIPPAMGRALATAHPEFVRFESIPGAGHDDVVHAALPRLLRALDER